MNCSQAKQSTALWVGGDLDNTERDALVRHISDCSDCDRYARRMRTAFRPLEQAADVGATLPVGEKLWPGVSRIIVARLVDARVRRFNGWVAGMAVAATVLAMVTISQHLPASSATDAALLADSDFQSLVPVMPVGSRQSGPWSINDWRGQQFPFARESNIVHPASSVPYGMSPVSPGVRSTVDPLLPQTIDFQQQLWELHQPRPDVGLELH